MGKGVNKSQKNWSLAERIAYKVPRRIEKYTNQNQYRNGKWYCKGGKIIDEARLDKYESMCHFMILKYLPAKALWEAAMVYEDLVEVCRLEVFLALLDGFDPVKAMLSTDPKRQEEKLKDPVKALQDAEKNIVFGRLKNYLRRTIWDYHPTQTGGKSVSYDVILSDINKEYENGMFSDFNIENPVINTVCGSLLDMSAKYTDEKGNIKKYGIGQIRKEFRKLDKGTQEEVIRHLTGKENPFLEIGESESNTQEESVEKSWEPEEVENDTVSY